MNAMRILPLLLLVAFITRQAAGESLCDSIGKLDRDTAPNYTPLARVVALPICYEGAEVVTIGYLGIQPSPAVYMSVEDADAQITANSVELILALDESRMRRLRKLKGKPVLVKGFLKVRRGLIYPYSLYFDRISNLTGFDDKIDGSDVLP